jgi:hypothetical protein
MLQAASALLQAASATIAGIALVVSVIVFVDNRLRALQAARLARVPMLAFTWDEPGQSWILTNIGNGPALDVVILQRIGGLWKKPLRMPEMAVQDSTAVPIGWMRWDENPGLGARYRSMTGEQYMTRTGDDWSQHSPGWGDMPATLWDEIEPHWRYRDDELISVRASLEGRREETAQPSGDFDDQSGAHSGRRDFFLSYRRSDSAGHAGRLYDQLADHFGPEQVFMDLDAIGPGKGFVERIEEAFGSAEALIVVIGRHWLNATDAMGRRQLDDPRDFVRREIEQALHQGISVIPLLIGGARMPSAEELPASLAPLASLRALEISDREWEQGFERLTAVLTRPSAQGRSVETR